MVWRKFFEEIYKKLKKGVSYFFSIFYNTTCRKRETTNKT